jgi:hypothetical protein
MGLGSPSGLLRGGLVDRRSISLFQLAALVSILEVVCKLSQSVGGWMSATVITWRLRIHKSIYLVPPDSLDTARKCYAQDPVFNNMDKELLASVGIEVVHDPAAFELVTRHTLLFAPGAERTHLMQLLPKEPALFFGGPLDNGPHSTM